MTSVLYIDDEEHLRIATGQTFELAGIKAESFDSPTKLLARLENAFDGVVVTDIRMPKMDGISLMQKALDIDKDLPVILLTGYGDVQLAVESIKAGAYDFLEKPCEPARLVACVERALERRRLTRENQAMRNQLGSANLVEARLNGRSKAISNVRRSIKTVANTDADILITGDTGTGKERAARAIHAASPRAQKPFVHINCAALPETLIESELFGHEAGAFPGATKARFGKLEHARGGVLCLDEIDSLPLPMQAKLLDVLHNRVVTRLGSNDPIPLDIRVIAISKVDLEHSVANGDFRADLLYRLNVITLHMPTLAERRDDIPSLFVTLVEEACVRTGSIKPDIGQNALKDMASRAWPGNVRELRNAAERFALGLTLTQNEHPESQLTLADQMQQHEKALISAAIAASEGNLKSAYESLGVSRKTLYDKMQKHGLTRHDFVDGD